MANKIITFDDHFATGEPTVQLISTPGRNGRMLREATSLHKTAAGNDSPALEYIKSVQPEEGKTTVLVIGLGDHETYGANRNGDGFPSEPVPGKIAADEVLTKHYQSYDNAHVFEHHVNHDPAKAIGRVKKAFWNPRMRRVEVVEDFDHKKAPHLLEKIGSGEYPSKSMGCGKAGTQIHTPTGRVAIETIAVGDEVITHTGAVRVVTELHRREYRGLLYTIHSGVGTSTMTQEHPYAVLPFAAVCARTPHGEYKRRPVAEIDTAHVHWTPAEDVRVGDYLLTPFDTAVTESLSVEQCQFLGYYAAEGNLHYGTSHSVVFTHHVTDTLREEMPVLARALGVPKVNTRPHAESAAAMYTEVRSKELAALCNTHVGRRAPEKRLSLELMRQPREQQLAFLGAMINGDGGTDSKGDFYIATCNRNLAHQLQTVGFRCGIYSCVHTINHKPSVLVKKSTVEYRVCFARRYCDVIAPYCAKVSPRMMKGPSTGPLLGAGFVISRVKEISLEPFEGPVYNFEVEGDNSYVTENHAVHNCKIKYDTCTICGNNAPTRKQYCEHLKYSMGKVLPDGRKVAALNPSPRFFDSSWVFRPADRTGFMLKKVADAVELWTPSYELAERVEDLRSKAAAFGKASAIEKTISGDPVASNSGLPGGSLGLVKKYSDTAPEKKVSGPSESQIKVMIEYTPSEALGTADACGMPLGLKDLIQFFMGRMGAGAPDDATLEQASKQAAAVFELFEQYPRFYDDVLKAAGLADDLRVSEKLANELAPQQVPDVRLRDTPLHQYRGISMLAPRDQRPNTDTLTYTSPQGQAYTTNLGRARETAESLEGRAQAGKYLRGAGYLGMGTLMGAAGLGKLMLGKRTPMNRFLGGGLAGLGVASGLKGIHEGARDVRMGDLAGPKVMTNEGVPISAYTEMVPAKMGSFAPEMAYVLARRRDGACATVPETRKLAVCAHIAEAEIADSESPVLGPTLQLEKTALLLETHILSCL